MSFRKATKTADILRYIMTYSDYTVKNEMLDTWTS